ncbi:MAG TPA: ATP-binding protein [Opitutus sp.]|nr:ATP-binding protein [Opitutus sp.]
MKRWWQQRTLRLRLACWYALGSTLLLSAFSATLYFYVVQWVAQPLDGQLREDVDAVRANLAFKPDDKPHWKGVDPLTLAPSAAPWFELWDARGRLVLRRWQLDARRVDRLPSPPAPGRETLSIFNITPELRLRVLSVPFTGPNRENWMLRVMRVHEPAGDALQALLLIIITSLPVVVTLLVVGGYLITRRWLKPLDYMVEQARRITADDLSQRLPVSNPHDELGQLATVFNVTLERLEQSFSALDRFVADASHELRTPLTTLRSVGEVGLRRSRTLAEYREIIGSMLEESQRLELLIERLLELASVGAHTMNRLMVSLDELVSQCVTDMSVLAEARGQVIELSADPVRIETDPVLLRQALQNILDNAIKYSPEDSTIRVVARAANDHCTLSVTDEGPGIPPEYRERIADRFFRVDRARSRSPGGFGLGLSITNAYLRVLGGQLDCIPVQPHGSTFRLTLPRRVI